MNGNDKPSLDLLARFLRNSCTPEEYRTVEQWLLGGGKNRRYLQTLEREWAYLREEPISLDETVRQRVWRGVRRRIAPAANVRILTPRKLWISAVAVAAIALLTGGLAAYFIRQSSFMALMDGQSTSVSTGLGQKSELTLPDGTRAWLNGGTKLSYPQSFNHGNRTVNLDGEAFFEVTENAEMPFIVRTDGLDVVVRGTAFDVSSYADDGFVEVSLQRGKVEVYDRQGVLLGKLSPRDVLRYDKTERTRASIRDSDTDVAGAWTAEELIFEDEPFERVVKKLERWYGVNIQWEGATEKRYTFKVKTESLREMLQLLHRITPIDYTIEGKEVKVKPRP